MALKIKFREDASTVAWRQQGAEYPVVQKMLADRVQEVLPYFTYEPDYSSKTCSVIACYDLEKIFGFKLNGFEASPEVIAHDGVSLNMASPRGNSLECLLIDICQEIGDKDNLGGAGTFLSFFADEDDANGGYFAINFDIDWPILDFDDTEYPTMSEYVDGVVSSIQKAVSYLKKMTSAIKRELDNVTNK